MSSPEQQLEAIVNPGKDVKFMGGIIRIRKLALGPLTRITPYLGPLAYVLDEIVNKPKDDKGKPILTDAESARIALIALSTSGESIMGVMSVITGKTPEELENADLLESAEVFAAAIEENLPFFSQENVEKFKSVWGRIKQVGTKFSKNSSNGGTAPKSKSSTSTPSTTSKTSSPKETEEPSENALSSSTQ